MTSRTFEMGDYTFIRYDRLKITAAPQPKGGDRKLSSSEGIIWCKESLYKSLKLKRGWEGPLTLCTRDGKRWYVAFETYQKDDYIVDEVNDGDYGHWKLPNKKLVDPHHNGFVYELKDKATGRIYVGSKKFSQPDWKQYTGSGDFSELTVDDVEGRILYSLPTPGQLNAYEMREIYLRDALFTDKYANKQAEKRIRSSHLGLGFDPERHEAIVKAERWK
jgi:hypothetical protein